MEDKNNYRLVMKTGELIKKERLRPMTRRLVLEGLLSEAEFRLAFVLKQTFYSPIRKRFAVIHPYRSHGREKVCVVYLEPPKPARFKRVDPISTVEARRQIETN